MVWKDDRFFAYERSIYLPKLGSYNRPSYLLGRLEVAKCHLHNVDLLPPLSARSGSSLEDEETLQIPVNIV